MFLVLWLFHLMSDVYLSFWNLGTSCFEPVPLFWYTLQSFRRMNMVSAVYTKMFSLLGYNTMQFGMLV